MKLIDLHKEWCEVKELSDDGLCFSVPVGYKRLLNLFKPTGDDLEYLEAKNMPRAYWGYGKPWGTANDFEVKRPYTPLRQTIVLFIAAMKNEI